MNVTMRVDRGPLALDEHGEAFAFDVLHDEKRPALVLDDVVDDGDVWMRDAGGGAGFVQDARPSSLADAAALRALERDFPVQTVSLPRNTWPMPPTPSRSSTTYGPMLIADLDVGQPDRARRPRRAAAVECPRNRDDRFEKVLVVLIQERLKLAAKPGVGTAGGDERVALGRRGTGALPPARLSPAAMHRRPSSSDLGRPCICRRSQSFAVAHSRLTVAGRNLEHFGDLFDRQAGEEPHLDDVGLARVERPPASDSAVCSARTSTGSASRAGEGTPEIDTGSPGPASRLMARFRRA